MVVNQKVEAMGDDRGNDLPAWVAAAWGLRERPARGPRPGLSLQRIVDVAVRIAVSDGLGAVSMARVAADLGASTMALYRYVAGKDELLLLMIDTANGPPPGPSGADEGWRAGMARWAWAQHAAARRHPWAVRVPIGGPPSTPNQVGWLERGLDCLRETGLTGAEKLSVILLVSGYVRNEAIIAADIADAVRAAGSGTEIMPAYRKLLERLTDADRFPAIHAVIASGALDRDDAPDDEFVFGLDRVLDGIDVLVQSRQPGE